MSDSEELVTRLVKAGHRSGDQVWRLPLSDDYRAAIKCDVADICNIGKSNIRAGAITAAHFLENFVDKTPWAHLDIAGTAFDVPNISYYRTGATGVGVRLFIDLIMNWHDA
jgi:leucyl aminopeptidase